MWIRALIFTALAASPAFAAPLDKAVDAAMAKSHARGLAIAIIKNGHVETVRAYGVRNAAGQPLTTDTIMYGASLTKSFFAYGVMMLVDQKRLDLDRPIAALLPRPLPDYPDYKSLAGDPRWKAITPRMALTHSTGFANFPFLEPDNQVHIHFDPGTRFAYSGQGLILLQLGLEQGLHLNMQDYTGGILRRLGMTRTSLQWRDDFAGNLADGFDDHGNAIAHDRRSHVRVAGSMDTTITDIAKFAAALVKGDGLSPAAWAEMMRPGLPITTAAQFPTFLPELPPAKRRPDLRAGLGVVTFDGPQGPGFYKGGHDNGTGNTMVCLERARDCVVILSNDVRAELGFGDLVRFTLGDTGVPYAWEYGDQAGKSQ